MRTSNFGSSLISKLTTVALPCLILEFCLSPQVVWSPKLLLLLSFLVLPNVFGPPSTLLALPRFQGPGRRFPFNMTCPIC